MKLKNGAYHLVKSALVDFKRNKGEDFSDFSGYYHWSFVCSNVDCLRIRS